MFTGLIEELGSLVSRDGERFRFAANILALGVFLTDTALLIEELETHQHPESLRKLIETLFVLAKEQNLQLFLTTHSMEEAEVLCDRVGILRGSRLLALDTVANLRADYGFQLKITYFPDGLKMDGVTLYGADDQELVAKVRDMGYQKFSVGQTSLEDIYLAMTGGAEGFNDDAF